MSRINFVENSILRTLIEEMRSVVIGAKLINIRNLLSEGYVFALKTPGGIKYLTFCLHASFPALYFCDEEPATTEKSSTPYDNHLKNARIVDLCQINDDRLVEIKWEIVNPVLGPAHLLMYGEFLGTFCNLVLIGADLKIIAYARAQADSERKARLIVAGAIYEKPPSLPGLSFYNLSEESIRSLFKNPTNKPLWKFLVHNITHLSPQMAREIICRADLPQSLTADRIELSQTEKLWPELRQVRELCQGPAAGKYYVYRNKTDHKPVGLSLFESSLYPDRDRLSYHCLNEAVAANHPLIIEQFLFDLGKSRHLRELKKKIKKATQLRKSLQRDLENAERADTYRLWGELIKANFRNLKRGQSELTVTNFYDPQNARIMIPLDPKLDLHRNADKYFRLAKKAEAGEQVIHVRIKKNNSQLVCYHRWLDRLEESISNEQLKAVTSQIEDEAKPKIGQEVGRAGKKIAVRFREFTIRDGWRILVGRNERENDLLTHRTAALDDVWFHAQGVRGSHVILRREGRSSDITPGAVSEAAAIAAWYSKARHSSKVPVDYVEVRFLRKPRGAAPGLVTYTQHKSLMVQPGLPPFSDGRD